LVINRVLRPTITQENSDENLSNIQSSNQVGARNTNTIDLAAGLDVADANAIEVNKFKRIFKNSKI
jgi:hypothetical protein